MAECRRGDEIRPLPAHLTCRSGAFGAAPLALAGVVVGRLAPARSRRIG
ncbi:hypothetical protein [Streptomyces djakartensis]|nr:hypothetical protein [Streptomyces djakartensis]